MTSEPVENTSALRLIHSAKEGERAAPPIDFQLIVENSLNLVVFMDADGAIEYVNPRFCEVTGYSLVEIAGRRIHELGELPLGRAAEIWMTVSRGEPWRGEFMARKKNGDAYWVYSCISPITSPAGDVTNYLAVNLDITERKAIETTLAESEEKFRAIVESSREMIWSIGGDLRIAYANPAAEEICGHPVKKLIGMDCRELVHPDDLTAISEEIGQVVTRGLPWSGVVRWRHADGSYRHIEATSLPVLDAHGNVTGLHGSARDVTDRIEAENALRERELRFRSLTENLSDVVSVVDDTGNIVYQSPSVERVLGYTVAERVGSRTFEYVHPDDVELARESLDGLMQAPGLVKEINLRVRHKDGTWRAMESIARSAVSSDGYIEVIVTSRDVTERLKIETKLRESEERLRTLLYNAPLVLFAWDKDGYFIASEGNGLEALGRKPGQVVGQHITSLYPEGSAVHSNYLRALGGETLTGEVEVGGRWFSASSTPLRGADGSITGVIGVAIDIDDRKEAEEALKSSEERLRLALGHAQMTAWEWDVEMDAITNTATDGPLLSQSGRLTYENFIDRVHEGDRERVREAVKGSLESGDFGIEFRVMWPDGSFHWVVASGVLARDANNLPQRLFGVAMDLTDRKEAEEALKLSEERLRYLLNNAPIVLSAWDRDGNYLLLEGKALEDIGLTPGSLVGRNLVDVMRDQSAEDIAAGFQRALDGNVTLAEVFMGNRWWTASSVPLKDKEGETAGVIGVTVDITARKVAEEALRKSEERYRSLYQDNPSMYFTVGQDGTVLSVNQFGADQLGYAVEELVGNSVYEVFYRPDRAAVRKQFAALAGQPSEVKNWEFRKVRKDGVVIWVKEAVRAMTDDTGNVTFLVVCEDISERKAMEAAMQTMREELERRAERAVARGTVYGLTFRQLTVLDLVAGGKSDKEIAVFLGIRPMTVSKHVANVLKKMKAASRSEAGVRAWREGLIR